MKRLIYGAFAVAALALGAISCDDNNDVFKGEYLEITNLHDVILSGDGGIDTINFVCRTVWSVDTEEPANWLKITPGKGAGGYERIILEPQDNYSDDPRYATLVIKAIDQKYKINVKQEASEVVFAIPSEIEDYDKFFHNSEHGGDKILRSDSRFSFTRFKQSEHFFVFWDRWFGEDPNAESVVENQRVDVDDLLAKAERFYETNIERLGMAVTGQGKSNLDKYKMQIYLLDPTPEDWVATGSGYDDTIGALWVTPATCHPVGSTIAHEIGHSFQYQVYADKLLQGADHNYRHGFRYGFEGPDGSGNGGCGYWEQCAQWQSFQDYPMEMFTSYNFGEWTKNAHRHFHHEWMRYASYWLQSYWVQKHGVEAYGRIWRESQYPEDAIMAYTRIYNGGDYEKTRDELFDYAKRMATFDIDWVRDYRKYADFQNVYSVRFFNIEGTNEYQIGYEYCPGATGFNVIALDVPSSGKVKVNFRGLGYGEALNPADKGTMVNGDGQVVGSAKRYNAIGGAENMGWRYGFVAYKGGKSYYSRVGKDAVGNIEYSVPTGTESLYLVVQGSPEKYMSHGWDEDESNDAQFPYAISLENTYIVNNSEQVAAEYEKVGKELHGSLNLNIQAANGDWLAYTYNMADQDVCDFFGVSADELADLIVQPVVGTQQEKQEGKIVVFNEEADGSLNGMPTANIGYWVDVDGNAVGWGNGHNVYYEIEGTSIYLGKLGNESAEAGETRSMRPVYVYTKDGVEKILRYTVTYNFK